MIELRTSGLIMLHNNKLLLTYSANKKAWYLPGGKIDPLETAAEALVREVFEELALKITISKLVYYCHVSAVAYGEEQRQMEQECFIYPYTAEIKPSNEIEAVAYFSLEEFKQLPVQVTGVLAVFDYLIRDGKLF
ncbi:NUDIX domain-containing protein [Sphingobacteriaceae bacterium WQ 2009]|uniref:NUDIX domain-containing protein n=1 Tax=Rhinopithecimicrobium faecis TaxID=2820698 RepID=A0A8T4HE85_9SPHI|nr:NUDIX domain-containing protein [Sphingobacteriaceae bacterium WQ 2009]